MFHKHTEPSAAQEANEREDESMERFAWGWKTIAPTLSLWPEREGRERGKEKEGKGEGREEQRRQEGWEGVINLSIDKGTLPFKVRINSQSGILHNLHRPLLEKEKEREREVMEDC